MFYTTDNLVKEIAKKAFPNYSGHKFHIKTETNPIDVSYDAYWSGGSRTYYNFVRLDTLQALGELPAQSAFDAPIKGQIVTLVPGLVCVTHSFFCGTDCGITIHVHPENAPKLLPDTTSEISRAEKIVLTATRSLKSIKDLRFNEANRVTGITINEWNEASNSLKSKGMLTKSGAITNIGRNIIQRTALNELK